MGKPTETLDWVAAGKTDDPAGIRTSGYGSGDLIPSYQHNWIFKNITDWQQFVDRAFGKTYYVKCTSGDDTNGDGSSTYPFKTIPFAVSLIENGGYGNIIMAEAGTYPVDVDSNLFAKQIKIIRSTNVLAADVQYNTYTDSGENNIYGFNLYRGASLFVSARNIKVAAPINTSNDWVADCSAIRVFDSVSSVALAASASIEFSETAATGSDKPSLVKAAVDASLNVGTPFLQISGTIITNSKGYVLNANSVLCGLSVFGIIDQYAYWIDNGITIIKPTLISGALLGNSGTTLSIRSGSEVISAGTNGTEVDSQLTDLLTDAYGGITGSDVVGTKTTAGGNVVAIAITVSGNSAKVIIGDIKSVATTTTYLDVVQGFVRKNTNVISNVPIIYQ